ERVSCSGRGVCSSRVTGADGAPVRFSLDRAAAALARADPRRDVTPAGGERTPAVNAPDTPAGTPAGWICSPRCAEMPLFSSKGTDRATPWPLATGAVHRPECRRPGPHLAPAGQPRGGLLREQPGGPVVAAALRVARAGRLQGGRRGDGHRGDWAAGPVAP